MFNYVRLSDGGIRRIATVRPEVTILSDIAERLLPDSKVDFRVFREHKKIREAIANTIPGMDQLADIDIAKHEFHIRGRLLHKPEFNTDDGRARFRVTDIPSPQNQQQRSRYPFQLTTVRSEGQFNTMIYEEADSYRPANTRWSVLMNDSDMQRLGLNEDDTTDLRSAYGVMESVTVYAFDLLPGDAMAYFPEANILVGRESDARSKTPAFKSISVAIGRG